MTHLAKRCACRAVALSTLKRREGGLAKAGFFTEPKNVCIAK
jgi:hypothetical protein